MIVKEDKIRMLWILVGIAQSVLKEIWSEEQMDCFIEMSKDFK